MRWHQALQMVPRGRTTWPRLPAHDREVRKPSNLRVAQNLNLFAPGEKLHGVDQQRPRPATGGTCRPARINAAKMAKIDCLEQLPSTI